MTEGAALSGDITDMRSQPQSTDYDLPVADGLSEIRQLQLAFWTGFAQHTAGSWIGTPTPSPKNWCYLPMGTARGRVVLAVSFRDDRVECKFALTAARRGTSGVSNRRAFVALARDRAAITRDLGFEDVVWGDPTPTRIYRRTSITLANRRNWQEAYDWLTATAEMFKKVLAPRLHVVGKLPTSRGKDTLHRRADASGGLQSEQSSPHGIRPSRSPAATKTRAAATIPTLFAEMARGHRLDLRNGTFPIGTDLTDGASWLALYSREPNPTYRYAFALWWGAPNLKTSVAWVLLNPSTGDTDGKPRPILTRLRHQSQQLGATGLIIVNLFAYRARDPKCLKPLTEREATGPHNDTVLCATTAACGRTIAAWGNGGARWHRSTTVLSLLHNPECLPKNGLSLEHEGPTLLSQRRTTRRRARSTMRFVADVRQRVALAERGTTARLPPTSPRDTELRSRLDRS